MQFRDRCATLIATWFGCGHSPVAPGTVGTLGAVPLHLLLVRLHPGAHALAVVGISVLGIWAAQRESVLRNLKDPQTAVIDEVAGVLIALGFVRDRSLAVWAAAIILFRVLDVVKPGAIDKLQYLKPEGLGIMADDLAAGVIAGVALRALGYAGLR